MTSLDTIGIWDCTVAFVAGRGGILLSYRPQKLTEPQHILALGISVSRYLQKLEFLGKESTDNFLTSLADNFISQKTE